MKNTDLLPEVMDHANHNWHEEAAERIKVLVEEEIATIRALLRERELSILQNQQGGGRGMLGGPPLKEASVEVSSEIMEVLQEWIGNFGPLLFPYHLALFKVEWPNLNTFFEFAKRYMTKNKFQQYHYKVMQELGDAGLV